MLRELCRVDGACGIFPWGPRSTYIGSLHTPALKWIATTKPHQNLQLSRTIVVTVCSPQGGDEELRATLPVRRAGPAGALPGVHRPLLGPSSRHHQQHPRGLDHQLLPHHHGAVLPAEEEHSHYPHPKPSQGPCRYHPAPQYVYIQYYDFMCSAIDISPYQL